jgi:hypothetical protein
MTAGERQRRRRERLYWEPEPTLDNWLAAEERLYKATWDMMWILGDSDPNREAIVKLAGRLMAMADKVRAERWPQPSDVETDDWD